MRSGGQRGEGGPQVSILPTALDERGFVRRFRSVLLRSSTRAMVQPVWNPHISLFWTPSSTGGPTGITLAMNGRIRKWELPYLRWGVGRITRKQQMAKLKPRPQKPWLQEQWASNYYNFCCLDVGQRPCPCDLMHLLALIG